HSRGVIHRDLKPANIMVGAFGEVQVMDWGLAKVLGRTPQPTESEPVRRSDTVVQTVRSGGDGAASEAGAVMGTPAYMASEQARGLVAELDERCDVFGLGAILCEVLTGQPPYIAEHSWQLLPLAAAGEVTAVFGRLDGCGAEAELVALVKACLAPVREARPRDAGAVAMALASFREAAEERRRQAERERAAAEGRAAGERKRRRLAVALAGSVALIALLVGFSGWYLVQRQRRAETLANEAYAEA